jgi:predicted aspartyl protease
MTMLGTFVAEFDTPQLTFSISNHAKPARMLVKTGIIDTGASKLFIPYHIASHLGLRAVGTVPTKTASGHVTSVVFLAKVHFPDLDYSEIIQVVAPDNEAFETPILIGMSVLRQFNIWYHGGMETFSFYRRETQPPN